MAPERKGSFRKRSSRKGGFPALCALLALAVPGSWGCCTVRCENTAGVVLVSPTDAVSPDPIVISKGRRQEILWKLPAGTTVNYVAITLGTEAAPFERCQTAEGVCRIACEGALCASGPVNAAVDAPAEYGYVFERPAALASLDPTIRIDP